MSGPVRHRDALDEALVVDPVAVQQLSSAHDDLQPSATASSADALLRQIDYALDVEPFAAAERAAAVSSIDAWALDARSRNENTLLLLIGIGIGTLAVRFRGAAVVRQPAHPAPAAGRTDQPRRTQRRTDSGGRAERRSQGDRRDQRHGEHAVARRGSHGCARARRTQRTARTRCVARPRRLDDESVDGTRRRAHLPPADERVATRRRGSNRQLDRDFRTGSLCSNTSSGC